MVKIAQHMLKAAGYKVRCDKEKREFYFLDKGEHIVATISEQEDGTEIVKWNEDFFHCERAIVNIARGRLFIMAEKGLKTKNPYIKCYIQL